MGYFNPGKKIVFSTKGMIASKFSKSPAMKEMMAKDPKLAKVFKNNPRRQREFYNEIKGKGSITKDEMREALGKLRSGTDDAFSTGTTSILGKEIIKYGKRYNTPKKEDAGDSAKNNIRDKRIIMEEKDNKIIQNAGKNDKDKSDQKSVKISGGSASRLAVPNLPVENKNASNDNDMASRDKSEGNKAENIYEALRHIEHGDE
jgi:hypothetical protein